MKAIDFIREVETRYDVKSIKVNDLEVWPFLRVLYACAYAEKHDFKSEGKKFSLWAKIKIVKNIFYGFPNLFKKYDYFVFSGGLSRVKMYDKLWDKYCDGIYEYYKPKILFIEDGVASGHYKRNQIFTRSIVSSNLIYLLGNLFFLKRVYIENEQVLKNIEEEFKLKLNYKKKIKKFLQYVRILNLFLKIYKPKRIFLSCYYSPMHQALIYTAHQHNIKVIELQHGIINNQHLAYNVFTKLDESFFPDYLFAFGEYVENVFGKSNYFIKKEKVIPVGSMYIDYINNEYQPLPETTKRFSEYRKKYKKIVAVSFQGALEDKLIDFLKKSASLNGEILYIVVPRDLNKDYSRSGFPVNITILKKLNVYQTIKEADFHSTLYSTCALEAPALGTPNILINIDDFARRNYFNLLTNRNITKFVDNPEQFVDLILNWQTKPKEEIRTLHNKFYKQNCQENLKQVLQAIDNKYV